MAVVTNQPGYPSSNVIALDPKNVQEVEWETGLCDCGKSIKWCCLSFFFPCIVNCISTRRLSTSTLITLYPLKNPLLERRFFFF